MPNQYALPGKRSDETPFPEEGRDLDDDLRIITKFSRALETTYSDVDVNMIGPGTFRGLVRALPYGTRTELYFEYCAYTEARGLPCASQSTFLRVANTILKPGVREGHLRFRKINEHGQCDRCWHLKHAISCACTDEEKLNSRKAHHRHVLSQWLDSQQYASLQAMAHNFFEALFQESIRRLVMFTCLPTGRMFLFFGSLLRCTARHVKCVNFDSMFEGSAEFGRELQCTEFGSGWHGPSQVQVPRVRCRQSKTFQKLWRPSLHVIGALAHSCGVWFYVSDEDLRKDAATQAEVISRTLDDILAHHNCLPHGLALQMDNTCREGKNQFLQAWMVLQVVLGNFRWTLSSYLRVGHSHLHLH